MNRQSCRHRVKSTSLSRLFLILLAVAGVFAQATCQNPATGGGSPPGDAPELAPETETAGNSLEVTWSAPKDESSVKEYIVRVRDSAGSLITFKNTEGKAVKYAIVDKSSGSNGKYRYTINNLPKGRYSPEVVIVRHDGREIAPATPPAPVDIDSSVSPPSSPSELAIAGHFFDQNNPDKQTVKLTWTVPASNGTKPGATAAALTGYTVYWAEGSAADKTSALKGVIAPVGGSLSTELTVAGYTLDAGKEYSFVVTASNDAGLEGFGSVAVRKPAMDFAVKEFKAAVSGNEVTVSWSALKNNPALKTYRLSFKQQDTIVKNVEVAQGDGTVTHSDYLSPGVYGVEIAVIRRDGTESRALALSETFEIKATSLDFAYKDDIALKAHNGKFSLGDFDSARLFKAVGLSSYAGTTIRQKVSVGEAGTVKHTGSYQDLAVGADGTAFFGITGMTHAAWAGITDNADAALIIELTEADGTKIRGETLRKTKTPDREIYTWRDLQNMKHKLDGIFELQNDVAFPAKDAQGFGSFAPVGTSASRFTGTLDGKGKTITGLYVSQAGNDAGLFGSMGSGGEVRDLKLADPSVSGASNVGAFAGTMSGSAALRRVEASLATGTMVEGSGDNVGGLAGSMAESSTALVIGAASGEVKGSNNVGGLVGHIGSGGSVTGTASGSVSGPGSLGGLAGSASTGASAGTARGYWDETSTGRSASAGGGAALSRIADVTFKGGRYFDGAAEVFGDAEWHRHFRLPKEAGKWPQLVMDASVPPTAPTFNAIAAGDISTANDKMTVDLSWTAPSNAGKKADGAADASVTKYTVYWRSLGTVSGSRDVPPASQGGVVPTSASIANLNPSDTYTFTVAATSDAGRTSLPAEDKTALGSRAKYILGFVFRAADNSGIDSDVESVINHEDGTVGAVVSGPAGLGNLKPTITVPPGASVNPASGTAADFSRPVAYTLTASDGSTHVYTVTVSPIALAYKDDNAVKAHNGKFSLGDFDSARLFKASGLGAYAGTTIKQKVSVKEGGTARHTGTAQNLNVDSGGDSALFGISGMSYGSWTAIADNADAAITIELSTAGGTLIASKTLTKTKTPDGAIYTWRDLQNMKHKLEGSFELRNDVAFPAKGTEGFGSFAPVGTSASRFTGKLDGKGKTVTGLYVSQTGNDAGLFGSMGSGGEVRDLKLADPSVSGASNVGAFAGTMSGSAALRRVEASLATGTMVEGSGDNVGGLAGSMAESSTALVIGAASGAVQGSNNVGGLVGHIGSGGSVTGTASGSVSGTGSLGGLAGSASTGASAGTARGYWDETSTGRSASAGGGAALSKIADVTFKGGRYFDGAAEVFDDAEWHRHFRLPKEAGEWPQLVIDASIPPVAPTLNAIGTGDISTADDKMTVDLSWTAPSNAGKKADGAADASVTKYTVYWRSLGAETGSQDLTPAAQGGAVPTSASIANLNPSDTYTFTVAATSDAGRSSLPAEDKTALGSRGADITAFVFRAADNGAIPGDAAGLIDRQAKTIAISVPGSTGLGNLKPTITVPPGASVSPASGTAADFSNPVTYTLTASDGSTQVYTVTVSPVAFAYKDDAAVKAHNGKFSLGDFDYARLFKASGLGAYAGTAIKQKASVKEGATVIHAGSFRNLTVGTDGTAYFGISSMNHSTWAGITENADAAITIELTTAGGTKITEETLTKTKTPDGSIYTWRDLQNMKHKLDGSFELQNNVAFPAKNTEGFGSFAPVGTSASRFTGTLDGKGRTVTGLYVSQTGNDAGLFGSMGSGGEVRDMKLADPSVSGASNVGAFAGTMSGSAALRRVEASLASGTMVEGSGDNVGGLVGSMVDGSTALVIGAASGGVKGSNKVGGLIGHIGSWGNVTGIASGSVSGTGSLGGLAGSASGTGASAARARGYWDETSSGQTTSAAGGAALSKIADVAFKGGRYFDGTTEVFSDAEWHKYFRLPKESGKWPQLVMDASIPPAAPTLNAIAAGDISTANDKMTIDLSWTAPSNAGKKADGTADASVTKYTVYWRSLGAETGSQDLTPAVQGGAVPTSASIADLTPSDTYTFTVAATSDANREGLPAEDKTALGTQTKEILRFVFRAADNSGIDSDVEAAIDKQNRRIGAGVPGAAGLSSLKPTITIPPGASLSPASGAATDFTNTVTYTLTASDGSTQAYSVVVMAVSVAYKDDAALKTHNDKFSLGDFDSPRLFRASGLTGFAGMTIRQKVSVKEGNTVKHAGSVQNLLVDADGKSAYFGISAMTFATWHGITSDTDATITVELTATDGTPIFTEAFTKKKTPYGNIYTWRDLQNMKYVLSGIYKVQNNFVFPAVNTQGFQTFVPLSSWGTKFGGKLDGNGKTITGLYISQTTGDATGLVRYLAGPGEIKDLKLVDPYVSETGGATGTFVGALFPNAAVLRVEATRETGTMVQSTGNNVGGLVGLVVAGFASGSVVGTASGEVKGGAASDNVGGLVGGMSDDIPVIGIASGKVSGRNNLGGLVGTYPAGPGGVHGYWDKASTERGTSVGGGVGISAIGNVTRTVSGAAVTFTDTQGTIATGDDVVVFNDTEFLNYYDLPTEAGKWPTLKSP